MATNDDIICLLKKKKSLYNEVKSYRDEYEAKSAEVQALESKVKRLRREANDACAIFRDLAKEINRIDKDIDALLEE